MWVFGKGLLGGVLFKFLKKKGGEGWRDEEGVAEVLSESIKIRG